VTGMSVVLQTEGRKGGLRGYPARLHRILVPYRNAASQQRERLEARDAESPGRRYPGEEHAKIGKNQQNATKVLTVDAEIMAIRKGKFRSAKDKLLHQTPRKKSVQQAG